MEHLGLPHIRILMTADTAGGVWDYCIELASGLRRYGVATVLAVIGDSPLDHQRAEALSVPDLCLEEGAFKLEWMQNSDRDIVLTGDWLMSLRDKYQPDVIHVNAFCYATLPWEKPSVLVAHSCVLTWWWQVKRQRPPEHLSRYAARVTAGLNQANGIVFLTRSLQRAMEGVYGRFPQSRVIWNGRNPVKYSPAPKEPFVFGAGRLWDEAKNLCCLDSLSGYLPWSVMIAGTCTGPDGCAKKPEKAKYLGVLSSSQIADIFSRASIFAHPARYEPFGLAVLEAGLSGCALVLSDIPTFKELWKDAALFVPRDDDEALRETLNRLIANPSRVRSLGRKARSRGLMYSSERMCKGYLSLYTDLLNGLDQIACFGGLTA